MSPIATAKADTAIYKKATPAVAWTVVQIGSQTGEGTAWVVDKKNRLLVTNHHVAGKAKEITLYFPEYRSGKLITSRDWYINKGNGISATLVTSNSKKDIAVIQVDELPPGTPELKLADESPEVGDVVHTVGHPGNNPRLWAGNTDEVQKIGRIQIDLDGKQPVDAQVQISKLQIYPGASGSPVLNESGRVVGVISGGKFDKKSGEAKVVMSIDVSEVRKVVAAAKRKLSE
jgi:S1-C subfamily serine protease